MRKEYSMIVTDTSNSFLDAIKDFVSSISNYTLIEDAQFNNPTIFPYLTFSYRYLVYYDNTYSMYIIFYWLNDGSVGIICTPTYSKSESVYTQKNIMFTGFSVVTTDRLNSIPPSGNIIINYRRCGYYYAVPIVSLGTYGETKFIANYNTELNTVMFTSIVQAPYSFGITDTLVQSIMFGGSIPYCDFEGGFFYGGTSCISVELFFTLAYARTGNPGNYIYDFIYPTSGVSDGQYYIYDPTFTDMNFHIRKYRFPPDNYTYPFITNPYEIDEHLLNSGASMPNPDNFYKLHLFLNMKDDAISDRKFTDIIKLPGNRATNPLRDDLSIEGTWVTTVDNKYYPRIVASISNEQLALPSYNPVMSQSILDVGRGVNTLNDIALCMPLYMMVRRDPQILNTYSAAAYNKVINFVDMYNMSNNRIINESFPEIDYTYNCFSINRRRSPFGGVGYNGIAFRQED